MAWFKRDYGTASYERAQQHFAKLFKDLGGPKGMMMVRSSNADNATLYIALSEVLAARNFPEFKPTGVPPRDCVWLFGHEDDRAALESGAGNPADLRPKREKNGEDE